LNNFLSTQFKVFLFCQVVHNVHGSIYVDESIENLLGKSRGLIE